MIEGRNYKGIHQRKNGTWYYRIKKIPSKGAKPVYCQYSGFVTMDDAYEARQTRLQMLSIGVDAWTGDKISYDKETEFKGSTFGEYFQEFLKNCQSEASIKKYQSLYNAQLTMWSDRVITTITLGDIETFLLRLSLEKKKVSYISSYRKMLKAFFKFARHLNFRIDVRIEVFLSNRPYTLKVLSLFSGIGAPEQALEELKKEFGIDYELVNFCELDYNAAKAFCLLHDVEMRKNIVNINSIDLEYAERKLPDFDLLVFGSPCTSFSKSGKREGLMKDGAPYPTYEDLLYDKLDPKNLNPSGLIFRAIQIALWKKPKFMVAENVKDLIEKGFTKDFRELIWDIQDSGYNIYFKKYDSTEFNIPQHRERVFMIIVRDDLNLSFQFPEPIIPKDVETEDDPKVVPIRAEEWFEKDVAQEYYCTPERLQAFANYESRKPNFKRDIIATIATQWGTPSYSHQILVVDEKGTRCLTSEELMRFQGFPPEYGTLLRNNGFKMRQVGKLVGNSITVPVIKAIIKQFLDCLSKQIAVDIVPEKIIEAQTSEDYISPLFAYTGNKSELLPYLRYRFPHQIELLDSTFVDLFAGSAFVAINTPADRVIINEKSEFLTGIYKALSVIPPEKAWEMVMGVVNQYGLCKECKSDFSCSPDCEKIPNGVPVKDIKKLYKPCEKCKEKYWACRAAYNAIPYEERISKYW